MCLDTPGSGLPSLSNLYLCLLPFVIGGYVCQPSSIWPIRTPGTPMAVATLENVMMAWKGSVLSRSLGEDGRSSPALLDIFAKQTMLISLSFGQRFHKFAFLQHENLKLSFTFLSNFQFKIKFTNKKK